ncbi:MAG: type II toxin-antitoxin system RelE/ParE family toxin [Flavobacterium sp.]|nr:type II toxin-antitoxin system RelE/ParE family toxin [Flavobacterium sp.]
MSYKLVWLPNSQITFNEEIDFIIRKWNFKEAVIFSELIDKELERLVSNPEIGRFNPELNLYSLTISKQTTLYFNYDKKIKIIDLYFFWNNQKNPNDLIKLL